MLGGHRVAKQRAEAVERIYGMRRMLLNLAAAMSLLIGIALTALWYRSYRTSERIVLPWPAHGMSIGSVHGELVLNLKLTDVISDLPPIGWSLYQPEIWHFYYGGRKRLEYVDPLFTSRNSFIGHNNPAFANSPVFEWQTVVGDPPDNERVAVDGTSVISAPAGPRPVAGDRFLRVRFPHWCAVSLFGGIFLLRAVSFASTVWLRKHRAANGKCRTCGYDLRATPDICPECGTAVSSEHRVLRAHSHDE